MGDSDEEVSIDRMEAESTCRAGIGVHVGLLKEQRQSENGQILVVFKGNASFEFGNL